ncbi:MAG: hypothetical protein GF401_15575 [Chitinivibrionales bacterium]|nr:hypothetical protein [Chitinivibrionales bacterium]
MTQSIERSFGAKVGPVELGFLYKGFALKTYNSHWAFAAGVRHLAGVVGKEIGGVADPRRNGWAAGPDNLWSVSAVFASALFYI